MFIIKMKQNDVRINNISILMAFFMLCAQISHIKLKNPFYKLLPSLIFLLMSLYISAFNIGLI